MEYFWKEKLFAVDNVDWKDWTAENAFFKQGALCFCRQPFGGLASPVVGLLRQETCGEFKGERSSLRERSFVLETIFDIYHSSPNILFV